MNVDTQKINEYANIFLKIIDQDYPRLNLDVRLYNINPRYHFVNFGNKEPRRYSYLLDEDYIKSSEQYVKSGKGKSGIEFFFEQGNVAPNSWLDLDYINNKNGASYGNWIEAVGAIYDNTIIDICPYFDNGFYMRNASEKGLTVEGNPLLHYLSEGWKHGIDFHPYFDSWYFIEKNDIHEISKPYLLYLFDNKLYEISPFVSIASLNHLLKEEIDDKLIPLYKLIFTKKIPIKNIHPELQENIVKYISDAYLPENGKLDEEQLYPEIIKSIKSEDSVSRIDVDLSIIIVNYRKPILTLLSTFAALMASKNLNAEIIIIDNESQKFETEILYRNLRNFKNARIISLKENVYFGEANNIGVEHSRGRQILFLNNDAFITETTLKAMIAALDGEAMAVSTLAINNGNQIVEAGGTITEWNDVVQNLKGRTYDSKLKEQLAKQEFRYVDYASAACLLVKKEFMERFGCFDPRFEPFYYEDTDLCKRITTNGYKIKLLTSHTYLHLENTSTRPFLKDSFDSVISRSRARFLEKWEDRQSCAPLQIKKNGNHKYRVGIYTPFKINPGGGENYILSILAAIGNDCNAILITPSLVSRYRVMMIAEQLGIELPPFEMMTEDDAVNTRFDLLFTMGNCIVPEKQFNSRIFYYHCQFPFPLHYTSYHTNKPNQHISRYICNSEFTKQEIESEIRKYHLDPAPIEVINPPIRVSNECPAELLAAKNPVISFVTVGRYFLAGHRKNQDKILNALLGASQNHELQAYMYGGLGNGEQDKNFYRSLLEANSNRNIIIDANVSNDTIIDSYKRSHFYIHAAGLDTALEIRNSESEHFGISLVEAMSYGCIPIVFGHGGPSEILGDTGLGFQYQSVFELHSIVNYLLGCPNLNELIDQQSRKCIELARKFDVSLFNKKIRKITFEAFDRLKRHAVQ